MDWHQVRLLLRFLPLQNKGMERHLFSHQVSFLFWEEIIRVQIYHRLKLWRVYDIYILQMVSENL